MNINTPDKISILGSFVFICSPIFDYYGYGFFSLAILLFFILSIYILLKRGRIGFSYTWPMVCYMIYFCCARILCNDSLRQMIVPSIIIMFLIWGILNRELKIEQFLMCYRYVAAVCIVFFVIQELMFYVSGYKIVGVMTFLPITNIGGADFDVSSWSDISSQLERSSSFFSEPAQFAQFLLPLVVVEMFYVADRAAYIRVIFYLITLMLLSSGNALLGICIIILFVALNCLKRFHPIIASVIILLFSIVIFYSVRYIITTDYGSKLVDRQTQIDPNQVVSSSGFVRIYRGYYIFEEMSFKERLLGLKDRKSVV